jgi:hypothetical protein
MSIIKTIFGDNPLRRGLNKAARAATKNAPAPVRQVASEASNTVSRKLQN